MSRKSHKRTVERITLLPHVDGAGGTTRVEVAEISMGGAKLQHYKPIKVGSRIDLRFAWREEDIHVPAVVVRSSVEMFASSSVFVSGVRFEFIDRVSRSKIRSLVGHYVKRAIDAQIANAEGRTSYESLLLRRASEGEEMMPFFGTESAPDPALKAMRDEGYVSYTLEGNRWTRTRTQDTRQPREGFTIWHFEDSEQAELLCRDYEKASPEMRNIIRVCAELSLLVDDRIPVQHFRP